MGIGLAKHHFSRSLFKKHNLHLTFIALIETKKKQIKIKAFKYYQYCIKLSLCTSTSC